MFRYALGCLQLCPRWGSPGSTRRGSGAPGGPVVQQAPTAVHRGAARVRPERWSSPASKIDRSGPVIQHPVRSRAGSRRRPTLTTHGDPLTSGTAAQVGAASACRHRSNEMTCRSRADGAEVVVEGAVRASARRSTCQWAWERPTWRVSWWDGPTRVALMGRAAVFGPLRGCGSTPTAGRAERDHTAVAVPGAVDRLVSGS